MFRTTLLLLSIACANAVFTRSRIVGGSLATINEAPWQVALLYGATTTGSYNQACGGVIITRSAVLSSAQCTSGTYAYQWRVRAGSSFHNSGGQVIQVSSYKQHEQYNSKTFDNDLVILYLAAQISLSASAAVVTLPAQGLAMPDGSACVITGWGRLSPGGAVPVQLYKVTLPSVNQAQCASAYSGFNPVTGNMLCAGYLGTGGMDACQGDAGGPLTVNRILVGISSWGRGCGEPWYPGVYTRVSNYRTWIVNNI